jgi:L-ascorbate metabolism protein UlaG (beta-lactamase superfamily)
MNNHFLSVVICVLFCSFSAFAQENFESDIIKTASGDVKITFIGHGTLMFDFGGKVIHVDPVGMNADYSKLPKADMIFVTHEHSDHLDLKAIETIRKDNTILVLTEACAAKAKGGTVMKNGDRQTVGDLEVDAVPAYNIVHMRSPGVPFHGKGTGNGYIIKFSDKKVYIAGDTEKTPEMKALDKIDVAFLPMNLPYTMTPEMVADAAKAFRPKVLYPYHYGETDTSKLISLMKDTPDIEIRIRKMK